MANEGLGYQHRKARAALLPAAYGTACRYCGAPMLRGQRLQLDHVVPRAVGGSGGPVSMVHGRCNEQAGARLGNAIRRLRPPRVRSRW